MIDRLTAHSKLTANRPPPDPLSHITYGPDRIPYLLERRPRGHAKPANDLIKLPNTPCARAGARKLRQETHQ